MKVQYLLGDADTTEPVEDDVVVETAALDVVALFARAESETVLETPAISSSCQIRYSHVNTHFVEGRGSLTTSAGGDAGRVGRTLICNASACEEQQKQGRPEMNGR